MIWKEWEWGDILVEGTAQVGLENAYQRGGCAEPSVFQDGAAPSGTI
jgi:hypothetical protein